MGSHRRRRNNRPRAWTLTALLVAAAVSLGSVSAVHAHPEGATAPCAICSHASPSALPVVKDEGVRPPPGRQTARAPEATPRPALVTVQPAQPRAPPGARFPHTR